MSSVSDWLVVAADAEKNSCIHAHYVNAILVCATTFPTAAFLVLLMRSLVLKHDRGGEPASLVNTFL